MGTTELQAISDFHRLAILDLHRIIPKKIEHNGRYWAYFSEEDVGQILSDYDAGSLTVIARDFVASIGRVKDRIFESERAKNGVGRGNLSRE